MKNLKWWQWCLIIFIGIPMVGATVDVITGRETSPSTTETEFEPANAEFNAISGNDVFSMTFNAKADPETLPDIAREQCGKRDFCKVIGWTDPKFTARGFPMTQREVQAQAFQYSLNRNTGFEQMLWDCNQYTRSDKSQCI